MTDKPPAKKGTRPRKPTQRPSGPPPKPPPAPLPEGTAVWSPSHLLEQENERLKAQIDKLSAYLLSIGGPDRNESACEMAKRVIGELRARLEKAEKHASVYPRVCELLSKAEVRLGEVEEQNKRSVGEIESWRRSYCALAEESEYQKKKGRELEYEHKRLSDAVRVAAKQSIAIFLTPSEVHLTWGGGTRKEARGRIENGDCGAALISAIEQTGLK